MHVRLQEELIDLEEAKLRLEAEMESMRQRENEIHEGLSEFRNIDGLQHKVMQTREVCLTIFGGSYLFEGQQKFMN